MGNIRRIKLKNKPKQVLKLLININLKTIKMEKERTLADIKQERIEALEQKVKHYQTMEMLHEQLIASLKEENLNLRNELKTYKK